MQIKKNYSDFRIVNLLDGKLLHPHYDSKEKAIDGIRHFISIDREFGFKSKYCVAHVNYETTLSY